MHPTHEKIAAQFDLPEDRPIGRRKRSRKRGSLNLEEKLKALNCVFIDHEFYADVAKVFRTSKQVIAHLVS